MKQLRNTIQRDLVMRAVTELQNHPTAEEIYQTVVREHANISRGTVYRNLNLLADTQRILRIEVPNAADRFDFNTQGHYHLACTGCGRVFDVDMPYQEDLKSQIRDTHGFEIMDHTIIFRGVCPQCREPVS